MGSSTNCIAKKRRTINKVFKLAINKNRIRYAKQPKRTRGTYVIKNVGITFILSY